MLAHIWIAGNALPGSLPEVAAPGAPSAGATPPGWGSTAFSPPGRLLPVTLLSRLLSALPLSHVSFPSFVCSRESCCLLCNRLCSSESLVQINKAKFALEWGKIPAFASSPCSFEGFPGCFSSLKCSWRGELCIGAAEAPGSPKPAPGNG